MATRSTIALEYADGTVRQIYCHYDGYLTDVGQKLLTHWTDPTKVHELMDLGDISILGQEIGSKHPFDNPHRYGTDEYREWTAQYDVMTLAYGRDRGEDGVESEEFVDFQDYLAHHNYEEYEYILRRDGQWYVKSYHFQYVPLTTALETSEA